MCVWLFDSYCSLVGILGVSSPPTAEGFSVSARHLLLPWITTGDAKPGCLWPDSQGSFPHSFPLILSFLQHLKHLLCSVLGQSYLRLVVWWDPSSYYILHLGQALTSAGLSQKGSKLEIQGC